MHRRRRRAASLVVLCGLLAAGCAARPIALPSGPGLPDPDFQRTFDEATRACRSITSLTAELSLSGRAGSTRLRARILAGLASPSAIRLEAVAPFGPPAFILAAHERDAVLLLPRDDRFMTGVPVTDILDALVGLDIGPDQMRALLTGCVTPEPTPTGGRTYGPDWRGVDLAGATAFLRPTPAGTRIVAATVGDLSVEYPDAAGGLPSRVRLRTSASGARGLATDLQIAISQLETNPALGPEVFTVEVPADARPLTIDELRRSGPLGRSR
jgi:hypothetical protein